MDRAIRARPRLAIPPHADRHDRPRLQPAPDQLPGPPERLPADLPDPRSHADPGFGARTLSPRDRLLATIITQRWPASRSALASITGTSQPLITRAIQETTLDLTAMGRTIPHAPIKATTTAALMALIGQTTTSQTGR